MGFQTLQEEKEQRRYTTVALRHASAVPPIFAFLVTNHVRLLQFVAISQTEHRICNNRIYSVT
ncbi:MAG: hypothetical protein BGN84_16295 [Afipia sp. 62-7]|nr:MAG: hypothetical protein BGN84_16295 [Afipia sp. 62-7]